MPEQVQSTSPKAQKSAEVEATAKKEAETQKQIEGRNKKTDASVYVHFCLANSESNHLHLSNFEDKTQNQINPEPVVLDRTQTEKSKASPKAIFHVSISDRIS
jgi:hypothetical protein